MRPRRIAVNNSRVSWRQNAARASALSTVKSFASPGRSRWAMRIASSARLMAGSTASALGIFTETTVVFRRP
jgi:hypothetical protein